MGTIKDFRLSVKAGLDLEDIFRYSEQQWGYAQAEIYIRGLIGSFTDLAGKKKSGRQCDYIRPPFVFLRLPGSCHFLSPYSLRDFYCPGIARCNGLPATPVTGLMPRPCAS
jgi:plasmid stabilization system protein ParE